MYTMSITASTGTFFATFPSTEDCIAAVRMVQNGAQVRQPVSVEVTHDAKKATLHYNARSCKGVADAVSAMLGILADAPAYSPGPECNRDVVVPVNFAMDGSATLEQAEIWVNQVMEAALNQHNDAGEAYVSKTPPIFSFNGEPAGQARYCD